CSKYTSRAAAGVAAAGLAGAAAASSDRRTKAVIRCRTGQPTGPIIPCRPQLLSRETGPMPSLEPHDEIRQALLQLLQANAPDEEALLARFEEERRKGGPVYSSILYILTHLTFSETEAERHWRRIHQHREAMKTSLGRDAGLRVAVVDYFVNVNRELKNPKVI